MHPLILSVVEAADVAGVSPAVILKWIGLDRLRAYRPTLDGKPTGDWRIPAEHLDRFLLDHGMQFHEMRADACGFDPIALGC